MTELAAVRRRSAARIVARSLFALVAVAALGLGAWGLWLYVKPSAGMDTLHRALDVAYYDLQMLVLSSNALQGGPYPWQVEVARFAAPAAAAYAVVDAIVTLMSERLARRRMRRRKGHTIVIGDTAAALAIARGLQDGGHAEVVMAGNGNPETLRACGLAGAAALYACESEDGSHGINVASVLNAAAVRQGGGLRAYAQVDHPDLVLALRARRLGLPGTDKTRLDFFNVDEIAARLVIAANDLTAHPQPHVLITGLGTFGQAILVEYARHWRLYAAARGERASVTVVDPRAGAALTELRSRWPFVDHVCDITMIDKNVTEVLRTGLTTTPTTVYICEEDEQLALRVALSAAQLWRGGPKSLVVRLNIMSRLGTAFHANQGQASGVNRSLDDLDGRLLLVGVTEIAKDTVRLIEQDLVERVAQAIHEHYLRSELASGKRLGDTAALRPWQDLSADMKDANRAQAADIGGKLGQIGCTVGPYRDDEPLIAFATDEVDLLARREHQRWHDERYERGWRPGERDDDQRRHPAMTSWDKLAEGYRATNRNAITALPAILADVGLRIIRLTHQPAPAQRPATG